MVNLTGVRKSVRSIVDDYGSPITLHPIDITTDKWGDKTELSTNTTTTVGIPYDIMVDKFNFQPIGDISDADLILIVKDTEDVFVDVGDRRMFITYKSVDYEVISVEKFIVKDITIAKQLIAKKRQ
jgi:hypothetical protein